MAMKLARLAGPQPPATTDCLDRTRGDGQQILADGRRVAFRTFGSPDGHPLIALHGTPGSRLKFEVAEPAARSCGLRIIAPDRWGYGCTDAHPAPSLAAYADDIAEFADALGLGRFAVMGVSGGGPYASAVASRLADRVTALAMAAPVGPIAGEDDPEISAFHRFCFGSLAKTPLAVGAVFSVFRAVLRVSPAVGMRLAMLRIAACDRRILSDASVSGRLGQTFVEGLRPGVSGPVIDLRLFGADWGLALDQTKAPARLWLGSADQNVPRSAARRLASRLPGCELVEIDGAGHLWIAGNYATVLGWIAKAARAHGD